MKKLIKQILKESINEKEYVKIFTLIDKVLSNHQHFTKETLIGDNLYESSNVYEFLFDYLTEKVGYDSEDTNQIIGSYILTNQHNQDSGDDFKKGVIIAKPKKYVGEFSQYVRGYQNGNMTTGEDTYSKPEAMYQFRNHYYENWEVTDDNTESEEFDVNDVWEDN